MAGSFVRDADYGQVYSKLTETDETGDTGDAVEFIGYGNRIYQLRVQAGAVTTGPAEFHLEQSDEEDDNFEWVATVEMPVASATVYSADVRITKPWVRGVVSFDIDDTGEVASVVARLEDVHYLRAPTRTVPEFEPPDPD